MNILEELKGWNGAIKVNDEMFGSVGEALERFSDSDCVSSIFLCRDAERSTERKIERFSETESTLFRITVRQYMTKKSSPDFDFMSKWNDDNPMPLRTMVGRVLKETAGMYQMELWGDITSRTTQYCMRCGRPITNPVSQFFGMGPECGGHNYVNPFRSDDELRAAVEQYRVNYLQKIRWTGWVIKSAILEKEVIGSEQDVVVDVF